MLRLYETNAGKRENGLYPPFSRNGAAMRVARRTKISRTLRPVASMPFFSNLDDHPRKPCLLGQRTFIVRCRPRTTYPSASLNLARLYVGPLSLALCAEIKSSRERDK